MAYPEWKTTPHSQNLIASVPEDASRRKYRLLGVACCRLIWPMLDPRSRHAVEVTERYAEGTATGEELAAAAAAARLVVAERIAATGRPEPEAQDDPMVLAAQAADTLSATDEYMLESPRSPFQLCEPICEYIESAALWATLAAGHTAARSPDQADLVRDIFAESFHPVTFLPEWRTSTAVALARQMYESRDFDAMPILADALQDAGCEDADVLDHCRGQGPHVRGCWVVDLVLGRG